MSFIPTTDEFWSVNFNEGDEEGSHETTGDWNGWTDFDDTDMDI